MTDQTKFSSLEGLREARQQYVTHARENGFEDGLRTLLADLYPDNAHFIYELLQNAEDARASEVQFDLQRDHLRVSHNGQRPFKLRDVEAITGIGQSTKKDEPNQIGKFGVGFKAVFAYTNHPEVHSRDYSFRIKDLFVPEPITTGVQSKDTTFVFPFDNEDKTPLVAFEEIKRGLLELGSSTVLFLNQITTVSYEIVGGESGIIERKSLGNNRAQITEMQGDDVRITDWLRLVDQVAVEGIDELLAVAAAFSLSDAVSGQKKSRQQIQPLDSGETCIYFPAAKETSGLKFHIHAPFASTVARDSVRNTDDNVSLVAAIGKLIVSELPQLRDDGLLNDGLLSALPNADDPLEAPYDAIRDLIYESFKTTSLTPVFKGGQFAPAAELFTSPVEFRSGLAPSDLPTLLRLAGQGLDFVPQWVAPRPARPGQFLKGLNVNEFGWDDLEELLNGLQRSFEELKLNERLEVVDEEECRDEVDWWQDWLASRTDEQLRDFLELLGHGVLNDELSYLPIEDLPLFRVRAESAIEHVSSKGVFLPTDRDDIGPNRILVSLAYFEDDKPSKARSALEAVYSHLEIGHWDERARVVERISSYASTPPDDAEHFRDLRLFISHLKANPHETAIFEQKLLRGQDKSGNLRWTRPGALVVDEPYEPTGLTELYPDSCLLDPDYKGKVKDIAKFAKKLGARFELRLRECRPASNPAYEWRWASPRRTSYGPKRDWDLPNFQSVVDSGSPVLIKQLWELACNEDFDRGEGIYQANGTSPIHRFRSRIALRMSESAWVLNQWGELRTLASMTVNDLPDGWSHPGENSLAVAAGFGKDERSRSSDKIKRQQQAKELGVPHEIADQLSGLSEEVKIAIMPALLKVIVDHKESAANKLSFPSDAPLDPDRRGSNVRSDATSAPEHEVEKRERSVAKGAAAEVKAAARQYLREQYTNEDGALYCQACHIPAEFKVKDHWYFETVQFIGGRKQLHHQNYLALCPLCTAKYKHVRRPDDEGLLISLADLPADTGAGRVELPILLNAKRVSLWFTGKHALDLQAVLSVAGDER